VSEHAKILFANEAFYLAFANRDTEAMDAVWAERTPVTCIHPGWVPIEGRDVVLESWAGILGHPKAPEIACREAKATRIGDVAHVLCFEVMEAGVLAATNLFVLEDGVWRMVHHQASAVADPPRFDAPEPRQVQ
jgi:hypothetical protein